MFLDSGDVLKIILAVLLGAVLGTEREYRNKAAGFRTLMLICLGACIFTMLSYKLGTAESHDRLAANIITGIGFLGAGAIFKNDFSVTGITTAAIIWVTAAIGMLIGSGHLLIAVFSEFMVLIILFGLRWLEHFLQRFAKKKFITIKFLNDNVDNLKNIYSYLDQNNMRYQILELNKEELKLILIMEVTTNKVKRLELVEYLAHNKEIYSFNY